MDKAEISAPKPSRVATDDDASSGSCLRAFQDICAQFTTLSQSDAQGRAPPFWGGAFRSTFFFLRHPIRGYASMFKQGLSAQTATALSVPFFPVEQMLSYLSRFSQPELTALKRVSEVNLSRKKAMITDNLYFKLGVPLGSAYALLGISDKLVPKRGASSYLDSVRDFLAAPLTQSIIGWLFVCLIFTFLMFAIQYAFLIGPAIARAQLLDHILTIALEGKAFQRNVPTNANDSNA